MKHWVVYVSHQTTVKRRSDCYSQLMQAISSWLEILEFFSRVFASLPWHLAYARSVIVTGSGGAWAEWQSIGYERLMNLKRVRVLSVVWSFQRKCGGCAFNKTDSGEIVGGVLCVRREDGWEMFVLVQGWNSEISRAIFAQNCEIFGVSLLALRYEAGDCITDAGDILWLLKTAHNGV